MKKPRLPLKCCMLAADPKLPYEDNSFDVITNAVSVDYLAKPMEVFKEMHRFVRDRCNNLLAVNENI